MATQAIASRRDERSRPPRVIFAELKRTGGKLSEAQRAWLDALQQCAGVEVYLWTPEDWRQIVETLQRR